MRVIAKETRHIASLPEITPAIRSEDLEADYYSEEEDEVEEDTQTAKDYTLSLSQQILSKALAALGNTYLVPSDKSPNRLETGGEEKGEDEGPFVKGVNRYEEGNEDGNKENKNDRDETTNADESALASRSNGYRPFNFRTTTTTATSVTATPTATSVSTATTAANSTSKPQAKEENALVQLLMSTLSLPHDRCPREAKMNALNVLLNLFCAPLSLRSGPFNKESYSGQNNGRNNSHFNSGMELFCDEAGEAPLVKLLIAVIKTEAEAEAEAKAEAEARGDGDGLGKGELLQQQRKCVESGLQLLCKLLPEGMTTKSGLIKAKYTRFSCKESTESVDDNERSITDSNIYSNSDSNSNNIKANTNTNTNSDGNSDAHQQWSEVLLSEVDSLLTLLKTPRNVAILTETAAQAAQYLRRRLQQQRQKTSFESATSHLSSPSQKWSVSGKYAGGKYTATRTAKDLRFQQQRQKRSLSEAAAMLGSLLLSVSEGNGRERSRTVPWNRKPGMAESNSFLYSSSRSGSSGEGDGEGYGSFFSLSGSSSNDEGEGEGEQTPVDNQLREPGMAESNSFLFYSSHSGSSTEGEREGDGTELHSQLRSSSLSGTTHVGGRVSNSLLFSFSHSGSSSEGEAEGTQLHSRFVSPLSLSGAEGEAEGEGTQFHSQFLDSLSLSESGSHAEGEHAQLRSKLRGVCVSGNYTGGKLLQQQQQQQQQQRQKTGFSAPSHLFLSSPSDLSSSWKDVSWSGSSPEGEFVQVNNELQRRQDPGLVLSRSDMGSWSESGSISYSSAEGEGGRSNANRYLTGIEEEAESADSEENERMRLLDLRSSLSPGSKLRAHSQTNYSPSKLSATGLQQRQTPGCTSALS
jgi:hypothetical protein